MQVEGGTFVILSPGFARNAEDSTCLPAQQEFVKSLRQIFPSLQIIIIAFQYPFTNENYNWHDAEVIPLNGRNRKKISRLQTWWRAWRTLQNLRNTHSVIGLLSFWCTECALVGTYFAKVYHTPHYTWILGQDARKSNAHFVMLIRPKADHLMAMSDFLANHFFENHGIRPSHIIPNGVPASSTVHSENRYIDILGAGSLISLKQYDLFVDLIQELKISGMDVRAVICGDGPEKKHLQSRTDNFGLQENLMLTGEKPHEEVLTLMQHSKILLHPSSYEGFSTVCLEALRAGAHVISFCKPMEVDIPNWHIVKNKSEMQEIIVQILTDPNTSYAPVVPYLMDNSVRTVMNLFGH